MLGSLNCSPDPDSRAELLALLEERARRSESVLDFVPRVSPEFVRPGHLAPLADLFDRIRCGERVRACVSVPPQHGKSELVLHGVARLLSARPQDSYAYATYQQDQSNDKSDRARTLARRAGVALSSTRATLAHWRTAQGGGCLFTSVGGPLTGQGVRALVFDDPYKNRDEALSPAIQRRVWSFFQSAALTRGQEGMSVIVVHTRWAEDDLIGRLAAQAWEVVNLPFLLAPGGTPASPDGGYIDADAVLNPRRVLDDGTPFGWTLDGARKHLAEVDEVVAEALYQGKPRRRAEGALWQYDWIRTGRVDGYPDLRRVVVAVDPAATASAGSDETGIVVVGVGYDGRGYVLADRSFRGRPDDWGERAVSVLDEWEAAAIVVEVNMGGDMATNTLHVAARELHRQQRRGSAFVNVVARRAGTHQGKAARAEPVASLYRLGRVSHVGTFAELEKQLTGWDPVTSAKSPDRLDALVWGLDALLLNVPAARTVGEDYHDL
jgi:hypothetical protein